MPIDPTVLDAAIRRFEARSQQSLLKDATRIFTRGSEPTCDHVWATHRAGWQSSIIVAGWSSSGRKICVKCHWVTDAPFEAPHGVARVWRFIVAFHEAQLMFRGLPAHVVNTMRYREADAVISAIAQRMVEQGDERPFWSRHRRALAEYGRYLRLLRRSARPHDDVVGHGV